MKKRVQEEFNDLFNRYPNLSVCQKAIEDSYLLLEETYNNSHKLLIAGNGGSAADAEHIAGELMKRFKFSRKVTKDLKTRLIDSDPLIGEKLSETLEMPLRAVPLTSHISITTAYMNDADAKGVFAQQLLGFGDEGDVLLAISTSGNSENIINACVLAKAMGIKIIGLTGEKESKLSKWADICIKVPETETFKIQELHLPVYHCLCLMLEENFFGEDE